MQLGRVFRKFCARNGQEVILRTPVFADLNDMLELINSLVEERAEISRAEKVTRDEEAVWLPKMLSSLEKDELFFLVAEVGGRVVASSDIHVLGGYEKHVGVLGIIVKNGFRDLGVGTEMMKTMMEQARALGLKVLTLQAFATNKRAIHVYENVGFVETGMVPRKHFKENQYIDEVIMTKLIQ